MNMNRKFIEQIPSYLKEFNISKDDIKKQQKWIEQKIMISFQNSLNTLMQEKFEEEYLRQLDTNVENYSSYSNTQNRNKSNQEIYKQSSTMSQNLIDIQLIKSQMNINQKEYPRLFPIEQQNQKKVKPEKEQKAISQIQTRHNISTQSTHIPPTSINNRQIKNDESLTIHVGEDEGGFSAYSLNPISTNNKNNKNKNNRITQHRKSHSNMSREYSYAEQQKKRKQFYLNNNHQVQSQINNSFNTINHYNHEGSLPYNKKNIYNINQTLPLN